MAEHITFDESQKALRTAAAEHDLKYSRDGKWKMSTENPWMNLSGNGYHLFANAVIELWLKKYAAGVTGGGNGL